VDKLTISAGSVRPLWRVVSFGGSGRGRRDRRQPSKRNLDSKESTGA